MPSPGRAPGNRIGDPFAAYAGVPVAGGELRVARAGPPAGEGTPTVLALHGISASHLAFRSVARELGGRMRATLLAPDLRGRGRSARLPGPFGVTVHVADLLAVLDAAGAERVVAVGHSMGAYVAARLAADHPDRVKAVVLLDAGLPFPEPPIDPDVALQAVVGPALERLHITFDSMDDYLAGWRAHPALSDAWDADIEAYARYDMVSDGGRVRCVVSADAVRADGADVLRDEATRAALDRVHAPVYLLRAPGGLQADDNALLPWSALAPFLAEHPEVRFEDVAAVNHYTLVMGAGPGPARVAAAIEAAAAGAPIPAPPAHRA